MSYVEMSFLIFIYSLDLLNAERLVVGYKCGVR